MYNSLGIFMYLEERTIPRPDAVRPTKIQHPSNHFSSLTLSPSRILYPAVSRRMSLLTKGGRVGATGYESSKLIAELASRRRPPKALDRRTECPSRTAIRPEAQLPLDELLHIHPASCPPLSSLHNVTVVLVALKQSLSGPQFSAFTF